VTEFREFHENAEFVRRLARRLVTDEDRARDVEQETWLAAWRRRPGPGPIRGWLAAVARNAARQDRRAESARARRERVASTREPAPPSDELYERSAAIRELVTALHELPEPYHSTLLLRYYEDLSRPEVARRQGISVEGVKTRIRRGLELLRERLDERRGGRSAWAPELAAAVGSGRAGAGAAGIGAGALVAVAALLALVLSFDFGSAPEQPEPAPLALATAAPEPAGSPAREAPPREAPPASGTVVTGTVVDDEDRPLRGATVVLASRDDGIVAVATAEAHTTDASGRFEIAVDPDDAPFEVYAEAPDRSPSVAPVEIGTAAVVRLPEAAALHGRITDRDGAPIGGARVTWRGLLSRFQLERQGGSGADGRYRVEGMPDAGTVEEHLADPYASMETRIDAEGFAPLLPAYNHLPDPDPAGDYPADFVLVRGATLEGRVLEAATGEPVPQARVSLVYSRGIRSIGDRDPARRSPFCEVPLGTVTTGPDGGFRFAPVPAKSPIPVGMHHIAGWWLGTLVVEHPSFATTLHGVRLPEDQSTVPVEVRLFGAAVLRGRVGGGDGAPVAGAHVAWKPIDPPMRAVRLLRDRAHRTTRTDAEGRYELVDVPARSDPPASVRVSANRSDLVPTSTEVAIPEASQVQVPDLVLESNASDLAASIRVVDRLGRPVANAEIRRVDERSQRYRGEPVRTDGEGLATIEVSRGALRHARNHPERAEVRGEGFGATTSEPYTPSHESPPEVTVVLAAEHRVTGRVLDENGYPVEGVKVSAGNARDPDYPVWYGSTTSAPDGSFDIGGLPEGPYHVVASRWRGTGREARAMARHVPTGVRDLRLVLPAIPGERPSGVVDLRVTDAAGRPLESIGISYDRGEGWLHRGAREIRRGEYRAELEEGTWRIRVSRSGYRCAIIEGVEVAAARPARVDVSLDRGITVRGRFLAGGEDLAGGKAWLIALGDHSDQSFPIGADGRFEHSGFEPGERYHVTASVHRGASWLRFTLPAGEFLEIPAGADTIDYEATLFRAGSVVLTFHCVSLPHGGGSEDPREIVELGRRSTLTVRDAAGRVAYRQQGILRYNWEGALPLGEYTATVEVPGHEPRTVELTVTASEPALVTLVIP